MAKREMISTAEMDDPAVAPEAVRERMERRARRSVSAVERRAKHTIEELKAREDEYKELMNDRIEQMKERYFVDRGVDKRVTAAQQSADVLQREMSAVAAKVRGDISARAERFKEGIAAARIEVDAGILTPAAACAFVNKVHFHALREQDRIDNEFADADTAMRSRVNKMEPVF